MNRKALFAAFGLVFALFLVGPLFGQATGPVPEAAPAPVTTPSPVITPKLPVKKEKSKKDDPNATLDGTAPMKAALSATAATEAEPAKPAPKAKRRRVDPAEVKPVDMSKFETAQPGEKPADPKATGTPFGHNKPVAGQKTVESEPLKKPANLQPKN